MREENKEKCFGFALLESFLKKLKLEKKQVDGIGKGETAWR